MERRFVKTIHVLFRAQPNVLWVGKSIRSRPPYSTSSKDCLGPPWVQHEVLKPCCSCSLLDRNLIFRKLEGPLGKKRQCICVEQRRTHSLHSQSMDCCTKRGFTVGAGQSTDCPRSTHVHEVTRLCRVRVYD